MDLEDENAVLHSLQGVEVVFHCAGKFGMWGTYDSFHKSNVIATKNVVEGCYRNKVKRLVHISTAR